MKNVYIFVASTPYNIIAEVINLIIFAMYSPSQIADYFLSKSTPERPITPMKLNKLVYIAHGWNLAIEDCPLIDEHPEAWKYGPVIPSLYHRFKNYGNSNIDYKPEAPELAQGTIELLNEVWEKYGNDTGITLSSKTHQPGTPWYNAWNDKGKSQMSFEISDNSIKAHYNELLLKNIKSQGN